MVPTNRKMNESAMSYYTRIIFCCKVYIKVKFCVQVIFDMMKKYIVTKIIIVENGKNLISIIIFIRNLTGHISGLIFK